MLKHIEVNNKQIPLNFGVRVMATTADLLGISFDGLCKKIDLSNPSFSDMIELIVKGSTAAMNDGARIEGLDVRYNEDDVVDMIDEHPEILSQLSTMLMDSFRAKDLVFTQAAGVSKPSLVAKKKVIHHTKR